MVATTQAPEVSGQNNQVITVGRDFVVADTYTYAQQDDFFTPNLEPRKDDIPPQISARLAALVRGRRVLLLGGQYEDKSTIGRHVVACLRDLLAHDTAAGNGPGPSEPPQPVLQWGAGANSPDPTERIRREETPTIFFLPNLLPQHIAYNLDGVLAAARNGHYVVATTDRPGSAWKLNDTEQALWYDLDPDQGGLFGPGDLIGALATRLQGLKDTLPDGLLVEHYEPERSRLGDMTLGEIAAALRTPHNIQIFAQLLGKQRQLKPATIKGLIQDATNVRRTIAKWYHTVLTPHEQLLTLSLSLFDGLLDDQFFAALEQLVGHIRLNRDPGLRSFDYCDIDELANFFNLIRVNAIGTKFESRLTDQRQHIFNTAWNSHRRQIIHALPLLTDLAVYSAGPPAPNRELYGTDDRRENLRRAIGDALSDIGLISVPVVRDALLRLAAHKNITIQLVAARALARWREYNDEQADGDKRLFAVLEDWQRDTWVIRVIKAILAGDDGVNNEDALAYIRATIALTVGYAAGYDPPNQLAPELLEQIRHLAEDQNQLVRQRFRIYMLPHVVRLHLEQLRGLLTELTRYIDLTQAIGASLAFAFEINPGGVLETLAMWHETCQADRPPAHRSDRLTRRDALLVTLAFAYGEIDYGQHPDLLSAAEGFQRLQAMLAAERHPKVRTAVVIAISRQASQHFERIEPLLQQLVAEVTEDERIEIVRILTGIYLKQRKELPNGPARLTINDAAYPVWTEGVRPLTAVESAMYRWIKDPANPVAQQIATQASIAFASQFDQAEIAQIANYRQSQQQRALGQNVDEAALAGTAVASGPARRGWYSHTFVPWLATMNAAQYRPIVRNLLPEAISQRLANWAALDFVLTKWSHVTDPDINAISRRLRHALAWHQKGWLLLVGAALAFVFFVSSL
ncbi:MAG TPA: hypothetical protein VD886_09435 [Herpetosiphonaceae bacterium]|nr:hypothetical protein [Herpetosiphonaceae bacterium]